MDHCHRFDWVCTGRQRIEQFLLDRAVFAKAALPAGISLVVRPNHIARSETRYLRTSLDHGSHQIPADDERHWRVYRKLPPANIRVDVVHGHCRHTYEGIPAP